jgi:ApaG protein
MFIKTTDGVKITAMPVFLADHSDPSDDHYVWAYTIQIENHGHHTVQLLNRYWNITDASGLVQEVRGEGVVGEQPMLKPGDHFQYTSGTALHTSSGIMHGTYEMIAQNGERFTVDIPVFSLDSPYITARVN